MRYGGHRSADAFTAELTLSRAPATPSWTLHLLLAPGQQVTGVSGPDWTQRGRWVTLRGTATHRGDAPAPAVFTLTGDLTRPDGAAPTAFDLNGVNCRPSVVIFTTEPAGPGTNRSAGPSAGAL